MTPERSSPLSLQPPATREALRRRLEDFLAKLEKKYGDLRGKVEMSMTPETSLKEIGGLAGPKREIEGLVFALKSPDLHVRWGTKPPKGVLLYGPAGTGKTLLSKALAREAGAVFLHLKLNNVVSKLRGESGELFQEVFAAVKENGRTVLFLDELDALSVERLFLPEEARAAGGRLVNTMAENLDDLGDTGQLMVVASTNRIDSIDAALVRPGRIDRFIEVGLPEAEEKAEIFRIHQARAEARAARKLFLELQYDAFIARMVKLSGADIAEIIQRALEEKVRLEGSGQQPGLVSTEDIQKVIEQYRRTKEVIEKIRYGQYL
ncbi:MAG TPA: AAA family ATPase [Candidatus Methylomirabilis sp.]|nr:AAA family ATPase [Candidatus Methylomirabilis sp.]